MSILEFRDFSVKLANTNKNIINNLSFKLDRGESLGIVGESEIGRASCRERV